MQFKVIVKVIIVFYMSGGRPLKPWSQHSCDDFVYIFVSCFGGVAQSHRWSQGCPAASLDNLERPNVKISL